MSSFQWVIALGPLSLYWLVLGFILQFRRPLVVSGYRDTACLGLALIGLFMVGPAELFFPTPAFNLIGTSVWIFITLLYLFLLLFAVLNTRPRIVVYGLDDQKLAFVVTQALNANGLAYEQLGQHFVIKEWGVEGSVEKAGFGNISHFAATTRDQNVVGWVRIEKAIHQHLLQELISADKGGKWWLWLGSLTLAIILYSLATNSTDLAQGFREMLRLGDSNSH
jgi:hypothetical protein